MGPKHSEPTPMTALELVVLSIRHVVFFHLAFDLLLTTIVIQSTFFGC